MDRFFRELMEDFFDFSESSEFGLMSAIFIIISGALLIFPVIYFLDTRRRDSRSSALHTCLMLLLTAGCAALVIGSQIIITTIFDGPSGGGQFGIALAITGFFMIIAVLGLKQVQSIDIDTDLQAKATGFNVVIYGICTLGALKPVIFDSLLNSIFDNDYGRDYDYDYDFGMSSSRSSGGDFPLQISVFGLFLVAFLVATVVYRKISAEADTESETIPVED